MFNLHLRLTWLKHRPSLWRSKNGGNIIGYGASPSPCANASDHLYTRVPLNSYLTRASSSISRTNSARPSLEGVQVGSIETNGFERYVVSRTEGVETQAAFNMWGEADVFNLHLCFIP